MFWVIIYFLGALITALWARHFNIWPRRDSTEVKIILCTWPVGLVYCILTYIVNLTRPGFFNLKLRCKFGVHDLYTEDSVECIYYNYKCKHCSYTKSVSYDGF
jgi:hypothetical protein